MKVLATTARARAYIASLPRNDGMCGQLSRNPHRVNKPLPARGRLCHHYKHEPHPKCCCRKNKTNLKYKQEHWQPFWRCSRSGWVTLWCSIAHMIPIIMPTITGNDLTSAIVGTTKTNRGWDDNTTVLDKMCDDGNGHLRRHKQSPTRRPKHLRLPKMLQLQCTPSIVNSLLASSCNTQGYPE